MSCTSCHRKHYAPTGARCPYKLGEPIPPDQQPEEDRSSQERDISDSEILTDDDQDGQRSPSPPYDSTEFELPSGQPDPTPSTSKEQPASPITLQQFADTTSGRVQQLEEERTRMIQTQELLLTQQRNLEEQLAALTQRWPPQGLQPNRDVRQKTPATRPGPSHPSSQGTEPLSRAATPLLSANQLEGQAQPPLAGPETTQGHGYIRQDTIEQYNGPPLLRIQTVLPPPATIGLHHRQSAFTPITRLPQEPQEYAPQLPRQISLPRSLRTTPVAQPRPIARQPQHWPPLQPTTTRGPTPGPSTLTELRTDTALMDRAAQVVSHNTQENTESGKNPKSGLKRDNTEQVCRLIPWPHEYVTRHAGKPPTNDSLTLSEVAAGNMRILAQIPGVPPLLYHMAAYLSELYDDISDTEWSSVRFAHKVVLQALENGQTDYSALAELRQMRSIAITRATRRNSTPAQPTQATNSRQRQWTTGQGSQTKRPCIPYQKGECTQPRNHTSAQGYVFHACAFCLSTVSRPYNHTEQECRRKNQAVKDKKNDEQGQEQK